MFIENNVNWHIFLNYWSEENIFLKRIQKKKMIYIKYESGKPCVY